MQAACGSGSCHLNKLAMRQKGKSSARQLSTLEQNIQAQPSASMTKTMPGLGGMWALRPG